MTYKEKRHALSQHRQAMELIALEANSIRPDWWVRMKQQWANRQPIQYD